MSKFEGDIVTNNEADQIEESTPPDGGYGWICVAACFIINGFTWGLVSVSCLGSIQDSRLT